MTQENLNFNKDEVIEGLTQEIAGISSTKAYEISILKSAIKILLKENKVLKAENEKLKEELTK